MGKCWSNPGHSNSRTSRRRRRKANNNKKNRTIKVTILAFSIVHVLVWVPSASRAWVVHATLRRGTPRREVFQPFHDIVFLTCRHRQWRSWRQWRMGVTASVVGLRAFFLMLVTVACWRRPPLGRCPMRRRIRGSVDVRIILDTGRVTAPGI